MKNLRKGFKFKAGAMRLNNKKKLPAAAEKFPSETGLNSA